MFTVNSKFHVFARSIKGLKYFEIMNRYGGYKLSKFYEFNCNKSINFYILQKEIMFKKNLMQWNIIIM